MSDETTKVQDSAEAFAKMWSDFAARAAAAGLSFRPDATPPEAATQVRDAFLRTMEQYWIDFMRSPQFLEGMKQTMDGAIAFRWQINEFLSRAHHEMQGAAREDIDSVMLCIRHLETRLLDRIDEVATRLDQITDRLDRLDGRKAESPPKPAVAAPPAKVAPERSRRKPTRK
jgi:hypothetical protein